jgi:hypothetical protein
VGNFPQLALVFLKIAHPLPLCFEHDFRNLQTLLCFCPPEDIFY